MNFSKKCSRLLLLIIVGFTITACGGSSSSSDIDPEPNPFTCSSVCLEAINTSNAQGMFRLVWVPEFIGTVEGLEYFQLIGAYNTYGNSTADQVLKDNISSSETQIEFHAPLHLFNPLKGGSTGLSLVAVDQKGEELSQWDVELSPLIKSSKDLVSYLKADISREDEAFGKAIAISADGSLLVVSAPGFSSIKFEDEGAVYTFKRDALLQWESLGVLTPESPRREGAFGKHLQLSADGKVLIVVGDDYEDNRETPVYVYQFDRNIWKPKGKLEVLGEYVIEDIALSGDAKKLAIGMLNKNEVDRDGPATGRVDIYEIDIQSENHKQLSILDSGVVRDGFGSTVALSTDGTVLAIGAPDRFKEGAAYIFLAQRDSGWRKSVHLKGLPGMQYHQEFGSTVALSGDGRVLAVGAESEAGGSSGLEGDASLYPELPDAGAVYVYRETGINPWAGYGAGAPPAWEEYIKSHRAQAGEEFSESIQLSEDGSILVIAAPEANGNEMGTWGSPEDISKEEAGAAFMYLYTQGQWRIGNYIKASNTDTEDGFGAGLALSADGQTLAVGAPSESSGVDGVNGSDQNDNSEKDAGAVYVY